MSFNEVNQVTGELNQVAGSFSDMVYADAPVGAIQAFGGSTAPLGWLMCDGSAVSRTTYAALFAVIGTRYGAGDGSTSFNLPSREAGAAVYPSADGNVLSESNYIIKAIKTAVPTDIQSELDLKQDITDNTLQTTSKTIAGAINEVNTALSGKADKSSFGYTVIASGTEGQTFGQQLATLKTTFDSLHWNKRVSTFVIDSSGATYQLGNIGTGAYQNYYTNGSVWVITTLDIVNGKAFSNTNGTITDKTNDAYVGSLGLIASVSI